MRSCTSYLHTSDSVTLPADESAFVRRWLPEISRAARFRVSANQWKSCDGDDLKQEAAIQLLRLFRHSPIQTDRYVRKSIKNIILNLIRDQRRSALSSVPTAETSIDEFQLVSTGDLENSIDVIKIREWSKTLPPVLRRVYKLLYCLDLSQRKAAVILSVTQQRIAQYHNQLLMRAKKDFAGFG